MTILLVVPSIKAEPTQQFNKIFLDPFYRQSMDGDTSYTYTININPPDKISEVKSAIVTFQMWLNPTVEFFLEVNGQTCNTPSYEVHTTYAGAGEGTIFFDCSNIITKAGEYEVVLTPNDDTGSITGWIDLTYMNNPKGSLDIFGTEYSPEDKATIFMQVIDAQGLVEENAICNLEIWNPLNINGTHTPYLYLAPMLDLDGSNGIYYYDLTAPSDLGVYMISAKCSYTESGGFVYHTDEEETESPDRTVITGTYLGSTTAITSYRDFVYTSCSSSGGAIKSCTSTYDFNTTLHFYEEDNFSSISLYFMGESSVTSLISFSVWNWTSSSWIQLPNNLTFSGEATSSPIGIGDSVSNNLPTTDIISGSGIIRIKLDNSFGNVFNQFVNWLSIYMTSALGVTQEVKGGGEMHITNLANKTTNQVWNYSNRSLTEFNFDVVNETEITEEVWNYSGTINNNILNQFASYIWNWTGTIANNILSLISSSVWTYDNRTLTDFNFTVNTTLNISINNSEIADAVWTHTPDRNLTYYPNMTCNPTLNATCELDYDLDEEDIWTYGNRTLTDFNFTVDTTLGNISINASGLAEAVWNYNGIINNNVLNQIADKIECYLKNFLREEDDKWKINIPIC